jgi:cobalt-precorrin 5A hydrolase
MKTAVVAFTKAGARLAHKIALELGGEAFAPKKHIFEGVMPLTLTISEWAKERFVECEALVFVSACGIAVRAVAKCVSDKMTDPAVVVVDEKGRFVIPLLSGHFGGANALASRIAAFSGGTAVITTATDISSLPAVDAWAKEHGLLVENKRAIKSVSSAILEGKPVGVAVTDEAVEAPFPVTLFLRPKDLVLGVGCKRGVPLEELQAAVDDFLKSSGYSALSLYAVASIDIKEDEPALLAFSKRHVLDFCCYSAKELAETPGHFTASERVMRETGVDNVCERAAVLRSGGGALLRSKTIFGGIALALARKAETV